jgi:Ca-activated chloride channel family protein
MKPSIILRLLAFLLIPALVSGHGIIIIDHPFPVHVPRPPQLPSPRPIQKFMPLEVRSLQVEAEIEGQKATTEFKQVFFNPSGQRLEGTFLFPVPGDAAIDSFEMEVNGDLAKAELLDARKARKIYEDIVRKARDPALFEYAGHRLFKVRIFPIEPKQEKEIRLKYTQLLQREGNLVRYICPLDTRKFTTKPIRNFSFKAGLKARKGQKLGTLYSPTHEAEIVRKGMDSATVGLEAKDLRADGDFEMFYSSKGEDGSPVDIQLLAQKESGEEEGHFLLLLSPQAWDGEREPMPKDVLFVLDTSGSMNGEKMEQAKKAMEFCINGLNKEDRFEVIRFSTEAEPLFDGLAQADENSRKKALRFVKNLRAAGGTAIDEALRTALEIVGKEGRKDGRLAQVLFLTDGRPTIGETKEEKIVQKVSGLLGKGRDGARIFNFGIGTDVNTHLLDKIAEHAGTFSQYVFPGEDLEQKVSTFFVKVSEPALSGLKLEPGEGVRLSKTYPRPLPDLFHGGQLTVLGRYEASSQEVTLHLEGRMGKEKVSLPFDAVFPKKEIGNGFIPRLWATRRVGYLLDEIRLHGDSQELRDEVVELARAYGIVTPYTSYLIVEDEERRSVPSSTRSLSSVSRDRNARESLAKGFQSFSESKSGLDALVSSSDAFGLKNADIAASPSGPVVASPEPSSRGSGGGFAGRPANGIPSPGLPSGLGSPQAASPKRVVSGARYAGDKDDSGIRTDAQPVARHIEGKTFYLNDGVWIDSEVQGLKDSQPVKVQFGGDDYFKLLDSEENMRKWLSVGTRCQIVSGGVLYEIWE